MKLSMYMITLSLMIICVSFAGCVDEEPPVAPIAHAGIDMTAFVDEFIAFDGSKSTGSSYLSFEWDYGDDSTTTGVTDSPSHFYSDVDVFTVTLTVTDTSDNVDTDTMSVTVINKFTLTVNSHGWYNGTSTYHENDYEMNVTVKNVFTDSETIYSTFFEIIATDGVGYGWHGDDGKAPSSLAVGSSATWTLYIELPAGKTPDKLVYDETLKTDL